MPTPITKESVQRLAKLARIDLTPEEEDKMIKDLGNILAHFEELRALDTDNIPPITSGMGRMNAFREDEESDGTNRGLGVELFPESEKGALKIPPVFE
jgi:aspartyl-tRNA(Asn)/glutamyl-tRNA(Gln) amidotransferase subunit C